MAAVCHGPAALTEAELNGKPLVKGKKVMACSGSCQVVCQRKTHLLISCPATHGLPMIDMPLLQTARAP